MKQVILISILLILSSNLYSQKRLIDSTVQLVLKDKKYDCIKRYISYNVYNGKDTTFYKPYQFFNYQYSSAKYHKVKSQFHKEYLYEEDPITFEISIYGEKITDSMSVSIFLGKISTDILYKILIDHIYLQDNRNRFSITSNYKLELSGDKALTTIYKFDYLFETKLKYELDKLNSGSKVFISNLQFQSNMVESLSTLGKAYWIIE